MFWLSLRYLVKLYLFWLVLFVFNRILFLGIQFESLKALGINEISQAFYYALPLDSSTACYGLALPFLVLWIAWWKRSDFLLKLTKIIVLIFIVLHVLIAVGDAALYTQWHTKLNYEALAHFAHPSEVFRTATWELTLLFFGASTVLCLLYSFIYNRFVHLKKLSEKKSRPLLNGVLFWLITGFVIFTGIRGGWRRFPISLSLVYYSQASVLNDAATNPAWYLLDNFTERTDTTNPYKSMSDKTAAKILDSLYTYPKDSTQLILTTQRPNIVLFILESWPADLVQAGHQPAITPVMDSLIKQGVYFSNCYPTGFVSDQGLPGILSAFPTAGRTSILARPELSINIPAINLNLQKVGYHSGFIYGGMLDFGNIQSYIYNKKFNLIKSGRDFPDDLPRGDLGVPDGAMVNPVIELIDQAQEPFFYNWYTLSTHPPYDIPAPKWMQFDRRDEFINTVHYADSSLGEFFEKVRHKPWYDNTLFVFVSDHSSDSQIKRPVQHKDRNRIPLLLYGNVIKKEWRGKTIDYVVSQLDIAATLLAQLKLSYADYPFSKDVLNPQAPHFAAYNFMSGSGFIQDTGFVAQDDKFKDFLLTNLKDSTRIKSLIKLNKAYEQEAYNYFLSWDEKH